MPTMKKNSTLVISDLHEPFAHRGAFDLCRRVRDDYKCKHILNIGDIFDHHQISRHVSEPDAMGAVEERDLVRKRLKKWIREFPKMDIIIGNHDEIPTRQAKELGIPKPFMRDLSDVYELPKGWVFHKKLERDDVLYVHNGGSGMNAAMNLAKKMSMSAVCGHTHKAGGVNYFSNPSKLFFGMNAGCLIDKEAYAMRYTDSEPTLGVGVVCSSTEAYWVPMKLN